MTTPRATRLSRWIAATALALGPVALATSCGEPLRGFIHTGDASAPDDATSAVDASQVEDAAVPPDAGRGADAAPEAAAPAVCTPHAVSEPFGPAWIAPWPFHSGACKAGEADLVITACYSPTANSATCQNTSGAHGACSLCVKSNVVGVPRAAIVAYSALGRDVGNAGGCVARLTGDVSATGCGAKVDAAWMCTHLAACDGCLPATTPAARAALEACASAAAKTVCATHTAAAETCLAAAADGGVVDAGGDGGATLASCSQGPSELEFDYFERLGQLFCEP
jgi:hypothetical protein